MFRAYVRRYFHCLLRLHRPATYTHEYRTVCIGCDCGRVFWVRNGYRKHPSLNVVRRL